MCNHALVRPIPSEDDTISSRTDSIIRLLITQNGKFIVRSSIREGEALVILVLVRITIAANRGPVLVVAVALLDGGINVILRIACATAGFCTLALGDVRFRWITWTKRDEHEGGDL